MNQKSVYDTDRIPFPSESFLSSHFKEFDEVESEMQRLFLVGLFRDIFKKILIDAPRHLMRQADRLASGPLHNIYLFKDDRLSDWVKVLLDEEGILVDLDEAAEQQLLKEMVAAQPAGGFFNDPWWVWKVSDDAIWIEITPDAKPNGGNQPRRSLEDVLAGRSF